MLKLLLAIVASVAFAFSPAVAEDAKWFCAAEAATGFAQKDGNWSTVNFAADDKYILAKRDGEEFYRMTKVGDNFGIRCEGPNEYGGFRCHSVIEYLIHTGTLRFLSIHPLGYITGDDDPKTLDHFLQGVDAIGIEPPSVTGFQLDHDWRLDDCHTSVIGIRKKSDKERIMWSFGR